MKKYFVIISLLLVAFVSINAMSDGGDEPEKITIPIDKELTDVPNEFERSMSFPVVEACAYPELGLVAVTLHNIGEATVRLIDSNNLVVSSDCVETDSPVVVYLNAHSCEGTYYLEVASPVLYAQGVVTF